MLFEVSACFLYILQEMSIIDSIMYLEMLRKKR